MKQKITFLFLNIFLISILSACSNGGAIQGWSGINTDPSRGTIFLANNSQIYALQLSNGNIKWRFPEKEDGNKLFFAAPTVTSDGQLIVASYDHKLYSLNPDNGQINWTFEKAKGKFIASPLVTEDAIYASCADENLYAIDMKGNPLWVFPTKHALWSKPVLHNGVLYLAALDSQLYAFNPKNGDVIWSIDMGGASVATPVLDAKGNLYIGTFAKEMLSIDPSGKIRWRTTTQAWVWSSALIDEQQVYFGDTSGNFYGLDLSNGKVNWQIIPSATPISGTPLLINNTIYFANEGGILYAIDKQGKALWNVPVNGKVHADLHYIDNLIFVAPEGGDALLLSFSTDGQRKWSFSPPKK